MARTKKSSLPQPKALNPLPANTQAILRTGTEAVAYHIPISPPCSSTPSLKSTIALPRRSRWTSGLHFHTTHTEYLRLIKGSIFLELNGELKILSAKAGGEVSRMDARKLLNKGLEIVVDRYARHNWGRAEEYLEWKRLPSCAGVVLPEDVNADVIVEEWTDPADITKPLFFWNLNGIITTPPEKPLSTSQAMLKSIIGSWWIPFQLFIVFWELDNWPVFFSMQGITGEYLTNSLGGMFERLVEYVTTFIVLFSAKTLGEIVNVRAVSRERTPGDLWEEYKKNRH